MTSDPSARLSVRYPAAIRGDDDLELRLVTAEDASRIFALIDQGRDYLRVWLPWVDGTRAVEDTERFIARAHEQMGRGEGFQACVEYRGELAGVIGHPYLDPANRRAEIGYWLGQPFQGRGIMTRACRTLVNFGFRNLELHRIEIRADVDNRKSRAIPERLGFTQEAVLREAVQAYGGFRDLALYSILRREWEVKDWGGASKSLDGGPAVPPGKE